MVAPTAFASQDLPVEFKMSAMFEPETADQPHFVQFVDAALGANEDLSSRSEPQGQMGEINPDYLESLLDQAMDAQGYSETR